MLKKIYFICALVALMGFHSSGTAATLKIATLAPDGTTWMKEFRQVAKEVASRTEGRVKIKYFPGGVMGTDKSVMRKMRIRQLQGGALSISAMAEHFLGSQIYGLPFLFNNHQEVEAVRDYLDPLIYDALEKKGFITLSLSQGGFAYIMSTQNIQEVEEFKSQKVWMPEGDDVLSQMYTSLGINPVLLPLSDVYTGLQTGLVDTVGINPSGAIALQWHTRIKHVISDPLLFVFGGMFVDKRSFNKLSQTDQGIVREVVQAAFKRLDTVNRTDNEKAKEALKASGVEFVQLSDTELAKLKAAMGQATQNVINSEGFPKEIYDQVQQRLTEYRAQ